MNTSIKSYLSDPKRVLILQRIAIIVAFLVSLYFAVVTASVRSIIFTIIFGAAILAMAKEAL